MFASCFASANSVEPLSTTVNSCIPHRYRRRKRRRHDRVLQNGCDVVANPKIGTERLILSEPLMPCAGLVVVPGVKPTNRYVDRKVVGEPLSEVQLEIVLPA